MPNHRHDDDPAAVGSAEDERYLVVDGRRWRRSDPAIPERLRAEVVAELMRARRAVRGATGSALAAARAAVHDAKVALGERGRPWWESGDVDEARCEAALRSLVRGRPEGSVCPSEVARVAAPTRWRSALPTVRAIAASAASDGDVAITQRGVAVGADARGPVRYRAAGSLAARRR